MELRSEISIKYACIQMVVSSESDIKELDDVISELQSSGHIIEIQCNKSSGIL